MRPIRLYIMAVAAVGWAGILLGTCGLALNWQAAGLGMVGAILLGMAGTSYRVLQRHFPLDKGESQNP